MENEQKQQLSQALNIISQVLDMSIANGVFKNKVDTGNAINAYSILEKYIIDQTAVKLEAGMENAVEKKK